MSGETTYDGPVVFGADGVHYAADEDGHPDLEKPLRWVEGTTYRAAEADEPLHNDVHHVREAVLEIGTAHLPGDDDEPIELLDNDEAEAVRAFLAERREGDS